jgi:alginate production protein
MLSLIARLVLTLFLLSMLLSGSFAAAKKMPRELRSLRPGQYVKVDMREDENRQMQARRIQVVTADGDLEIEGIVQRLDQNGGKFSIAGYAIEVFQKSKFEDAQKQPKRFFDMRLGDRVRVKARAIKGKKLKARAVRIFGPSQDNDLELTGPIERVDLERSEIVLFSLKINVDRKTRYTDPAAVAGQEDREETADARYIRRDDDAQHPNPMRLGRMLVGGRSNLEHQRSRNFDLDTSEHDSEDWLKPAAELEMSVPLGERSEAYAKFNVSQPMRVGEEPNIPSEFNYRIREAFLLLGLHRSLELQIGRQRFRDRREWLYDDQLDAVRLHIAPRSKFRTQLAVAQRLINPSTSRKDQLHLMALSEYQFSRRRYLSAYIIKRNDLTDRDEDPLWIGLSSRGRIVSGLDYWAELAKVSGRRDTRLIGGYGYDVGGSYRLPLPLQPTIAAGYAWGSGDNNLDDGTDGNFRQTRLNDNAARYNGLKRYRYYGVLTQPELNNLGIQTLDVGIRHSQYWSLNLSVHNYRQAIASKRLGDMALTIRPRGRDPRLGREYDAVLAVRVIRNVDFNFYTGLFLPGPAFDPDAARAFLFRQEVIVYF